MNQTPLHSKAPGDGEAARAVAIGASAGAIEAMLAILPQLPADFAAPLLIVVHLPPKDRSLLADLFRPRCAIQVEEAEDKSPVVSGVAYFAPPDYHLLVETDFRLSLSSEEPIHYSRPSIDVLFESAAVAYGQGLVGVILTGANSDGAQGLASVARQLGTCFVQEPAEAFAPTMPAAALAACPSAKSIPLSEMARSLLEAVHSS